VFVSSTRTRIAELLAEGQTPAVIAGALGVGRQSWHAAKLRGDIVARGAAMPLAELLTADTPRGRFNIKRRLLLEGVKDGRCDGCGVSAWRGAPLSLELHHVNGDRHDNRVENLALLCPNCHSQTDSYSGRNRPQRAA
jgi:HNH endonuclease